MNSRKLCGRLLRYLLRWFQRNRKTQGRQILAEIDAGGRLRFTIDVNPLRLYCAIMPANGGDPRVLFAIEDDRKRFIMAPRRSVN